VTFGKSGRKVDWAGRTFIRFGLLILPGFHLLLVLFWGLSLGLGFILFGGKLWFRVFGSE
jgi:hypothetical protein